MADWAGTSDVGWLDEVGDSELWCCVGFVLVPKLLKALIRLRLLIVEGTITK